jgi:hypothetical protein
VRDAVADFAVQAAAIAGNPRAWEANLRRRGEWNWSRFDQGPEMPSGNEGAPQVQASVVFMGLPKPPTPEEAERLRPPPGSGMIVNAQGVMVDRSRKDGRP